MLRTGGHGIIAFELAGTPERSREIMDTWGPEGRAAARLSLLLDYPFLLSYCGIQVAGCAAASDALRARDAKALATAGRLIGAVQIAAGAFDVAENTALLGILAGRTGRLSAVARACAQAKFVVLIVGWLYEGLGVTWWLASLASCGHTGETTERPCSLAPSASRVS